METTSEDILKQIENVANGLPEDEDESVSSIVDEWPRKPKQADNTFDDHEDKPDGYVRQDDDDEALRERWRVEEPEKMKEEFLQTGVMPRYRSFDEWKESMGEPMPSQREMQTALAEDINDLYDRYGEATHGFFQRLRRGELQMPDELLTEDNAFEQFFISNITEDEARRMTPEQLQRVIDGANREPLRTRSLDIAVKGRKRPTGGGNR